MFSCASSPATRRSCVRVGVRVRVGGASVELRLVFGTLLGRLCSDARPLLQLHAPRHRCELRERERRSCLGKGERENEGEGCGRAIAARRRVNVNTRRVNVNTEVEKSL